MRKEDEKILNYSPLAKEIRKIHRVSTKTVPVVVGALGVVSGRLAGYLKDLQVPLERPSSARHYGRVANLSNHWHHHHFEKSAQSLSSWSGAGTESIHLSVNIIYT